VGPFLRLRQVNDGAESGVMDSSLSKPTRIGAYDIVDTIGRGGMGTVFRGKDPRIGRQVAIKVLTAAADDPDLLIRFYREAKYTGSLHHQNIVTVYELGHQDGVPYLVMEYLEGVSLDAMIASGRAIPLVEKLGIILQVCSGLTYAHKQGLVHRDIKPANIVILGDGTAKIVDFGIALLGGSRLTRTGHVVGSLNYMSPEQLSGNVEVDARTDVYSTGVVLFQLLTGVLPFDGGTTAATLKKILQDPPPPLTNYMPDRPEELEGILGKALAKNRDERYPSPEDFAFDLARVHQKYEKKMMADALGQAAEALRRKDFATARQQVALVLKAAPYNAEGAELLRQIRQGQEQQQRDEQVLHLQMKAEEAFRKNQLEEAMRFIEQGLQLDPAGAVFPALRDAVAAAQNRRASYLESLKRAESALKAGDLEAAKRSVEAAQQMLPDEAAARSLAAQIVAQLEQRSREQQAAERQRKFAMSVNAVEKAMADARMLLLLGQMPEALQALGSVESTLSQLPPRWTEQHEALKKEVLSALEKKEESEKKPPAPQAWEQTADLPAQFSATVLMEAGAVTAEQNVSADTPIETIEIRPPTTADTGRIISSQTTRDVLFPRPERPVATQTTEIAPELREFFEPEPSRWSRPIVWLGIAAVVLVSVLVWMIVRPKSEVPARAKSPGAGATASYTYAEINAEPWATVAAVVPANGEAQSVIGQQTPLRVKLPPGQYSVTLQGPRHEEKRVEITVPQQGGTSCFAVFQKPDLNRLVGKD
jgi:tetratricopeptide (TPR) repeat protein